MYVSWYTSLWCVLVVALNRLVAVGMPTFYERLFSQRNTRMAIGGAIYSWGGLDVTESSPKQGDLITNKIRYFQKDNLLKNIIF